MKSIHISKDISNTIKGAACLLIVAHHFFARLMGIGFDNIFINIIGVRGGVVGVTVFFFLSAWGLSESQNTNQYSFITFIKRRLFKVYIPLLFTNCIYCFYLLLFEQKKISISSFLMYVLNYRLIDGVLWFCNTILIFYLLFNFSFLLKPRWGKVVFCIVSTFCYSAVATIMFPNSPFYVYGIIGFPVGMACSLYKEELYNITRCGMLIVLSLLILIMGSVLIPNCKNILLMNSFCFILLVILVIFIQRINITLKLWGLPLIGVYSYEIYLVHNKVLTLLGDGGYTTWYPLFFVLIVIPMAMLLKFFIKFILNSK